jgi:hypothetical protein
MKIGSLVGLLLVAVALGPAALAGEIVKVKVPFTFTAGATTFPPGDYVLAIDQVAPGTVQIRGPKSATVLSNRETGGEAGDEPVLRFTAYGERRFLTSIRTGSRGWTLPRSKRESELAETTPSPEVAVLAAYHDPR